jgi:ParB family chromosome partitioning protein
MLIMTETHYNSIFWIDVDKIKPNPFQPRQEFNDDRLRDLADSIRQYGVLQPLVVTRREFETPEGGLATEYELIAGERRLRASKLAGLSQVPAMIRSGEDTDKMKLEMAIIENLQREDLNPVDRAQAFSRLVSEFGLKHGDVGKRVGKSREYVTNTIRILMMPQEILDALVSKKITEGHTRPIMMLNDRPAEQATLFKEIIYKKLTVREAEMIARRIAVEKVRRLDIFVAPEIIAREKQLTEKYGTRVHIVRVEGGGKVTIDFFSDDDLRKILDRLEQARNEAESTIDRAVETSTETGGNTVVTAAEAVSAPAPLAEAVDDSTPADEPDDPELYSVSNFSL